MGALKVPSPLPSRTTVEKLDDIARSSLPSGISAVVCHDVKKAVVGEIPSGHVFDSAAGGRAEESRAREHGQVATGGQGQFGVKQNRFNRCDSQLIKSVYAINPLRRAKFRGARTLVRAAPTLVSSQGLSACHAELTWVFPNSA